MLRLLEGQQKYKSSLWFDIANKDMEEVSEKRRLEEIARKRVE